jgi:hypothetical protein
MNEKDDLLKGLSDRIAQSKSALKDEKELTDSIMFSLPEQKRRKQSVKTIVVIQRALAAACIAMAMIFSYEQFQVVRDVNQLERKITEYEGSQTENKDVPLYGLFASKEYKALIKGNTLISYNETSYEVKNIKDLKLYLKFIRENNNHY